MQHRPSTGVLFAVSASLSLTGLPLISHAQSSSSNEPELVLEEIVVTARRREQLAQDVADSITVFNQEQLDNANVVNAADLALYTPSMQTNPRFGSDNTTFAIRGFAQELRTTASVGVYFAEVIAPRGANSQQSGDGAGPGDFFDLANVQVLKGPTGTLFGRNTTGGAVLITPQQPTDELEGYLEVSGGNYDMWRQQGVLNVPITDNFKMRFGIDNQSRDGYLNNISGIGPDDFADLNYTAYRVSALWNITDNLENYTVMRYSESDNNGYPTSLFACNTEQPLGVIFCQPDLDARQAAGNDDFYDVYSFVPKPVNEQEFFHVSNRTTWQLNDSLAITNILAYGTLETRQRSAIYGSNWQLAGADFIFQMVGLGENQNTTDQETWVEELRIYGDSFDEKLFWQAGIYYEKSEPVDDYGAQSPALISCDHASITSANPDDFRCNNLLGVGALQRVPGGVTYTNQAIYAQATYDLSERWSLTAGLRYTKDETEGYANDTVFYFPPTAPGSYAPYTDSLLDRRTPETDSDEPTWLIGVDYKPTENQLFYAKYNRGYRQGSVNIGGSTGLDIHGPEQVDTYELGSKTTFQGSVAGTLNVALFYNDFQDQQVQFGYFKTTGVGTTAIVNAGASTIWGMEVEANLQLTNYLILSGSYTYLDTEVDSLDFPPVPPNVVASEPTITTAEGEPLSFAPENKLVLTGTWIVPINANWGDMRMSLTYVYTDEMQAVSEETSRYATLPDYELVNLNVNWSDVLGSPVDVSLFGTNLTDEEYVTYLTGNWNSGFEFGQVGQPRMYGARVRYKF